MVTWPDFETIGRLTETLSQAGIEVRLAPKTGWRTVAEMKELVSGVSAAIVSTDPFDAAIIASAPDLRVIAHVGVGADSIDLRAATRQGVAVIVSHDSSAGTVADHTVGLMLAVTRRICAQNASVRSGLWERRGGFIPRTLSGNTIGIVGFGRVGRLVAKRLCGFEADLLVNDRRPVEITRGVVSLPELLRRSDVVSLHVPLTPTTHNLIGEREFGMMREDAILVNTAQGGVVDESALERALMTGRIAGAALDVFMQEPPTSSGLLRLPNLVLSPHNAGLSVESVEEMTRTAVASVIEVLSGEAPSGRLANPTVLKALSSPEPLLGSRRC